VTSVFEIKVIEFLSAFVAENLMLIDGTAAVVAMIYDFLLFLRLGARGGFVLFHSSLFEGYSIANI